MPIDPCREWLGIDAVDLASPHLVLAVRPDETDAKVIEGAAAERLRHLRGISPGPFERAHAALVSRITEARDEMLDRARNAAARQPAEPPRGGLAPPPPPLSAGGAPAWPGVLPAQPLAPPPVPVTTEPSAPIQGFPTPTAPLAEAGEAKAPAGEGNVEPLVVVGRGRRRPRRSSDAGWIVATIASLAAVAASLVAFFAISGRENSRRVAVRGSERPRVAREEPAAAPRRIANARRPDAGSRVPREEPTADNATEPAPRPEPMATRRSPAEEPVAAPPPPAPQETEPPTPEDLAAAPAAAPAPAAETPEPEEATPDPDPETDPVAVERALQKAFAEVRAGRFPAAKKAIDQASAAAADELTVERVERWRLLVTYATKLAEYRDTALGDAAKGGDYTVDGTVISVIELNPTQFVYKERGAMMRPSRDAIPPRIILAILETWFAADGRPANDIYLGVQHLVGDEPDLAAARTAWRRAGQGGEDVAPLMGLLSDSVLRRDRQE